MSIIEKLKKEIEEKAKSMTWSVKDILDQKTLMEELQKTKTRKTMSPTPLKPKV